MGLLSYCDTGSAGNGSHQYLHTPVLQSIVRIDSLLGITLVILEVVIDLVSVDSACSVDLVNSDLNTILYSGSVDSGSSGNRSDSANLERLAAFRISSFGLFRRGALFCRAVCGRAVAVSAACSQRKSHRANQQ